MTYISHLRNSILLESEELDEMNTSSATPGYETPNAFSSKTKDALIPKGFRKAKKKSKPVKESLFMKFSKQMYKLDEISYNEYKKDDSATAKQKVNNSINEINKLLREVEKIVSRNLRLKTEAGIDNSQYWKSSKEKLVKISERMIKVSKHLTDLSA